jgi:hypothetical protein
MIGDMGVYTVVRFNKGHPLEIQINQEIPSVRIETKWYINYYNFQLFPVVALVMPVAHGSSCLQYSANAYDIVPTD